MSEKLLLDTLDECASRNIVADFWLRDDDAVEPTPALEKLLSLCAQFAIPVTLAVIPAPTGKALVACLDQRSGVDVAVHGWAHENHAGPNEKKRELGLHRPLDLVLQELREGLIKLHTLHGDRFVPMLVPPWNRIDAGVVAHLPQLGYGALSVYGPEEESSLTLLNTHVDVIDWRGTRGGKDHDVLFAEIAIRIRHAHDTGRMTGILTHHLDHDDSVWAFLRSLFELTSTHPGCRWCSSRLWLQHVSP